MSVHTDRLSRIDMRAKLLARTVKAGTAVKPRHEPIIDLALERAEAWATTEVPVTTEGDVGGSSSPGELGEAAEKRKTKTRAAKAVDRLDAITKQVDRLMDELYTEVQWLTTVSDPSSLKTKGEPGCTSCARQAKYQGVMIGGHWAPIYEKSQAKGLCDWCWRFENATGQLPPVKACDLLHSQGKSAANRWLAQNEPNLAALRQEARKPAAGRAGCRRRKVTHLGRDHVCVLEPGHEGDCSYPDLPPEVVARLAAVPS